MLQPLSARICPGDSPSGPTGGSLVFVDADNTLWDTDAVYARAQLHLLARVEGCLGTFAKVSDRLGFVRAVDQCLAEKHHRQLRYPVRLLIRALEHALSGLSPEHAARLAWSRASDHGRLTTLEMAQLEVEFSAELSATPRARRGVMRGLSALRQRDCRVVVLTEGSLARVRATATALAIDAYLERVVEVKKEQATLVRIHKALGAPVNVIMVGDQLERDIRPAQLAGFTTVYFPGRFRPRWERTTDDITPDFTIHSFTEVATIVGKTAGP